jgi:HEPN domain-containing protein
MAEPRDTDARRFYRAARERWDDAEFLRDSGRTTAAVYMAGYSVECALKALVISHAPKSKRKDVLATFRGKIAHDLDWLRRRYAEYGGARPPLSVAGDFRIVDKWDTDLRYEPRTIPGKEADEFLAAVRVIWAWADGRR